MRAVSPFVPDKCPPLGESSESDIFMGYRFDWKLTNKLSQ